MDTQLIEGTLGLCVDWGAMVGVYTVLQVTLQESDTNTGGWTTMLTDAGNAPTSIALGLTNTVESANAFLRTKRYVRASITATSGTSVYVSVSILGRLKITGSGAGVQL